MALAYAVLAFAGEELKAFTWTPITGALSSPTPLVFGPGVIISSGSGVWIADLVGQPDASGGTVQMSSAFTGLVVLLGMDPP